MQRLDSDVFQAWDEVECKVPTDCTSKLQQIKNAMLIEIDMLKEVKEEQEKQIDELIEALEQAEARAIAWEKKAISWEKKAVGLRSELASMKDELSQAREETILAKEETRSVEEEKRLAEERAGRAMKENLDLKAQLEQLGAGFEKRCKNMEQEVTEESDNVLADLYLEANQVQAV